VPSGKWTLSTLAMWVGSNQRAFSNRGVSGNGKMQAGRTWIGRSVGVLLASNDARRFVADV
jgi:hypothetical protein